MAPGADAAHALWEPERSGEAPSRGPRGARSAFKAKMSRLVLRRMRSGWPSAQDSAGFETEDDSKA